MGKCTKCNHIIQDSDMIYWKCPSCAKVFEVDFARLKGLQRQKKRKPGESLLKCPGCGYGIDDGSEKIAYRCKVCGNVSGGNLEFMVSEDSHAVSGPKIQAATILCSNCGAELEPKVRFCPDCGTKVEAGSGAIFQNTGKPAKKFPIKIMVLTICSIFLFIAVLCAGIIAVPKLLQTPEELISQGNFEKAYSRARDGEKTQVLVENLIADICNDVKDNMKDPSSFELRKVWYEGRGKKRIVLQVSGKNSFGGIVSNYWLYLFDEEEGAYDLFTTIDDMEEEEYKSYDDLDDTAKKVVNNFARLWITEICVESSRMEHELIDRINALHEEDLLKDIVLLKEIKTIYPFGMDGGEDSDKVI